MISWDFISGPPSPIYIAYGHHLKLWSSARKACDEHGLLLATFQTHEEFLMASDALPHLFRTYWVGLKKNRIANEYRWVTGERPSDAFLENITGKRMVELLSNPRECFFLKKRKRRLRLEWCSMSNRYLCQRLLSTPIVPSKVVLC